MCRIYTNIIFTSLKIVVGVGRSLSEALKIGMLSWESLRSVRVGGLAQAVTGMAEGLVKNGHEVHVFTRSELDQSNYDVINGVHYHRCKFDPGGDIFEHTRKMCDAMIDDIRKVENKSGKFDVIHGHDWMVADALEKLQDHYRVMSFHSTEQGRTVGGGSKRIAEKEWLGGYVSNKVLTVSQAMKSELEEIYQIPSEKIHVVPNGCFIQDMVKDVDPGRIKEKYDIHPLAPMILFLGRMTYQKGPDIMLDAIPHVFDYRGDAEFVLVGDGEMRWYLEMRANQLGISHSTRFLGYLPDEDKLDLLNATDVVCIPSRNEPFGLVLFEAWAAGDAVVASNVGGLRENIDNFVNGIKTTPSPQPIAWGINFAIDNPELVRRLGREGKKKLREFRWDRICRKLRVIYRDIENYGGN